tara:strand:- start:1169 stop:1384 length:216 start_codon:yes stop_codon:yes gene_type:complete
MSNNDLSRRFPIAIAPDKTMVHCEGVPIKIENMPYYLNQTQSKRRLKVEDKIKVMCEETKSTDVSIRKRIS